MAPPRFFHPNPTPGTVQLGPEESHHATTVRHLRAGEPVVLFDGAGREAAGVVDALSTRLVTIRVDTVRHVPPDPPPRLTLAFAPPRSHRQGFLIEKCTELGTNVLQPIETTRSVAKAHANRLTKWRRRTIEAAKQCGAAYLPEIRETMRFDDLLTRLAEYDDVLIAHGAAPEHDGVPGLERSASASSLDGEFENDRGPAPSPPGEGPPDRPILQHLLDRPHAESILVMLGPEGGWTAEELISAQRAGAARIGLTSHTLRIETAALAVATIVASLRQLGEKRG